MSSIKIFLSELHEFMIEEIPYLIHKTKRRITELQMRMQNQKNWSYGEIEIYKQELKRIRIKLKQLNDLNN